MDGLLTESLLQAMRAALLVLGLLPSVLCDGNVELLGLAWTSHLFQP